MTLNILTFIAMEGMTLNLAVILLLFFVGLVLLAVEAFVIPGFGVPGILGIASMISGCVVAWMKFGAIWGLLLIILSIAAVITGAWLFFSSRAGRKLVLTTKQQRSQGTQSYDLSRLMGKRGRAVTDLRPSGIAQIEDERVDVATDGIYLEAGTEIKVVSIEGPRVTVAPVRGEEKKEK